SGNNDLVPTAISGTHHVECTLTRNVDSFVMGTIVGNDFDVIDAETTGTETLDFQTLSSTYFDRTMDTTTTQITVDVDFSDLYIGQAYSVDWELCFYSWNNCNLYEEATATSINDPAETEGQFSITSTTGTHTESFTFTDPGILEIDWNTNPETVTGISNQSYYFEAVLHVQNVYIAENSSNPFILGGEMVEASSYMSTNENILKNTGVSINGEFNLDYHNEYILEYEIECGLFEDGITTPVDTYTFANNDIQEQNRDLRFEIYGGNNDLVPTAVSGTHHVECTLTRSIDSFVMGTIIGNDFDVIDDTGNQDDATITVSHTVDSVEGWATVTIEAIDLDAGQSYSLVWEVDDNTMNPVVDMDDGSYEWVEGTDGVDTHIIEFRALGDSTDACFSITFFAGVDTLQTESAICWNQLSTSDMDGDGVYDKDDQCANTPASVTLPPGSNGCADSDNDGWDDSDEIACNTLPGDPASTPIDIPDVDGICNYLDDDDDDDGFLDIVEDINQDGIVDPGETDPLDANSFPANRLPTCGLHYTLEADGMPAAVTGEAVIPALSPAAAAAANAAPPPQVTLPAGSYYIIASCIDLDGDPITVQVNGISVGPLVGEVNAGAIIEIGPDVAETLDVTITWSDGTDSATATITVNLDGSAAAPSNSGTLLPGFTTGLGIMAMLSAVFIFGRRNELV
nr:hypothetical protein [Candidatus Poseidoniaceae archaeon]